MKTKLCNKCNNEKPLSEMVINKKAKDGFCTICKECKANQRRIFIENNREMINLKNRSKYNNNKEKESARKREYWTNNKNRLNNEKRGKRSIEEKIKRTNYMINYRSLNKERLNSYRRERRNSDELFKLTSNIRTLISNSFRNNGVRKNSKTNQILGCSIANFKEYLESKWELWMNWGNYGSYNGKECFGWDIDHIIPLKTAMNEEDIIKLNHHSNLQPLCSRINRDIKIGSLTY
jgi:hypothetical protein